MTNEQLEQLITNINLINSTQQFTYIQNCLDILNIRFTNLENLEYPDYYNLREKNIIKLIRTTETLLSDKQKTIFYSSLNEYYLFFTSNTTKKEEIINNLILENNIYDTYGYIDYHIIFYLRTIKDDNYLYNFIKSYNSKISSDYKAEIITSLENDDLKIQFIEEYIDEPENLAIIIKSIKNDRLKLNLYNKYKDILEEDLKYISLLSTFQNDSLKIQCIKEHPDLKLNKSYDKLIISLQNEESLYKLWNIVPLRAKIILIYKMKEEQKVNFLNILNNEISLNSYSKSDIENITDIIINLSPQNKKYIINNCHNINFKLSPILRSQLDYEDILFLLKKRGNKITSKMIRTEKLLPSELILNNIDLFLDKEEISNKTQIKDIIYQLYQTNNDIVYTILWPLLTPKYIETLGLNKLNVLCSFRELEDALLKFDEKQYETFYRCLNNYTSKNTYTDWNYAAYQMIKAIHFAKMDDRDITHLITDFNQINIDTLTKILIHGDQYGIKTIDDIINYEQHLKEKTDKDIKSHNLSVKRNAIFIKGFGLSDHHSFLSGFRDQIVNGLSRIYHIYKTDIDLIESTELKKLFSFIKKVLETNSEEELEQIYKEIPNNYIDSYKLESQLKNELLKLYNKELLQLDNLKQNKDGLYEAGTEFSIIATSIGAYVTNTPENYKTDWNRPSLASQHFCTNFIRNDMLGTAPIPHLMYGFTHMEPYSLLLSGPTDIYSSGAEFISKAYKKEVYYAPNNQINQTAYNQKYKYNEMDFKRIQNGQKKQPDYILVFRKNGLISNLEEAKKASMQWDNLPIVVIDIDLCLKSEYNKLIELINQFYQSPTLEIYNQIKTKILNNRITEPTFAENINLNELKEMINSESISNSLPIKK